MPGNNRCVVSLAVCLLLVWVIWSRPVQAEAQPVIVVNPALKIQSLTIKELRAIFSMRMRTWPDGTPVRVFVLPTGNETHTRFSRQLLRVYPHQLQKGWDRLVYTGTGQAPQRVSDELEMRQRIAAEPGAIGYLMTTAAESVRVVTLVK